ncbi:hypothetical protein LP414_27225 [Polaromonas sp. P1(28)-13]|nr:hypothetical protein LP414_27225 [Polaromonas sp. P1(28)-13]
MDISKLEALMKSKKASMKRVERTAKLNPGKNRVRVLSGWRPAEQHIWYHDFGQHFIKDAADQIQAVYVCAAATFETDCAVCGAIQAANRTINDDDTQKTLDKAKASRTVLVNALMLDSSEPNTPVILELKRGVFGQLIEILEEWGPVAFFDPEKGQEIAIQRDGKGLNTTYTAQITPKVYSVPAASMARLNNLDEYVKQDSDEQERRAIGAVNSVAGLLAAPKPSSDTPRTPVPVSAASRLAAPAAFEDVPDLAVKPSRNDIALDAELDDLLGDLTSD